MTVPQIGLNGYSDTELLNELDKRNIDIFITIDGNIAYQQQFQHRTFATIIIRAVSNRFIDLKLLEVDINRVLPNVKVGEIVYVSSMRPYQDDGDE